MAIVLAVRVVAGLGAAVLAALLLEYYGLADPPLPLPQTPHLQRPHPAPGAGNSNIFWGLQVMHGSLAGGRWRVQGCSAERDPGGLATALVWGLLNLGAA